MKKPKINDLVVDELGTRAIRSSMKKANKIKITINIDANLLATLKTMAAKTSTPYQRLLNKILAEAISKSTENEDRLERIEKEITQLKKKIAV